MPGLLSNYEVEIKGFQGFVSRCFSCAIYSLSTFINSAKASKKNLIDYQGNRPSEPAAHFPPAGKPVFVLQGNALPRRLRNHYRRQLNVRASLQLRVLPKGESVQAESPTILAITPAWIRRVILVYLVRLKNKLEDERFNLQERWRTVITYEYIKSRTQLINLRPPLYANWITRQVNRRIKSHSGKYEARLLSTLSISIY